MTSYKNESAFIAAMALAEHDIYVFPVHSRHGINGMCTCQFGDRCKAPAKHPIKSVLDFHGVQSWKEISTNKPTFIQQWFNMKPYANYAVDCGKSGLAVLDFDDAAEFERMLNLYPDAFRTVIVRTGSGRGYHVYYWQPVDTVVYCPKFNGLDVKGVGGYVIAPGSLHISNKHYVYVEGRSINDIPILQMPDEIVEYIRKPSTSEKAVSGTVVNISEYQREPSEDDERVAESWLRYYAGQAKLGNRHHTAWKLALQLRDNNVCYSTSIATMEEYTKLVNEKTFRIPGFHSYDEKDGITQYLNALKEPKRPPAQRQIKRTSVGC